MGKIFSKLTLVSASVFLALGVGTLIGKNNIRNEVRAAYAADGDEHSIDSFTGKDAAVLLNNGATPDTIELSDPGYPVKQVVIGWKHNKTNNGITANVSVGGESLGSGQVGGQNTTTTTTIGDGETSLSGAISISFSSSLTSTGQGTLYLKTLTLVEGSSIDPSLPTLSVGQIQSGQDPTINSEFTLGYSTSANLYSFGAYLVENENATQVTAVNWTSSNPTIANVTQTVNGVASITCYKPGTIKLTASHSESTKLYNDGEVTVNISAGWLEEINVTGSMTKTEYTTLESWDHTGLTATAVYHYGWEEDVTSKATWTYSPAAPATNVTSVVATATYDDVSGNSSAQTVSVTVAHAGTEEDPFTVAEALAKCTAIGAVGNTGQGPWVTRGIISRVTSAPAATYWNATYYISDDGTQSNELQVYRGFYLNNAKFDSTTAALLTAGKIVTITGNLTGSYGSEYCQGNYLLALEEQDTGDVDVSFTPDSTSLELGATGTFTATSETAGVGFAWSSDNPSILTVDASTGAFEAVGLGVARVTVTATVNDKEGSTYADITVNGADVITIDEVYTIASALPSSGSDSTTKYYVYVEGYVSLFDSDSKTRAFDIVTLDETKSTLVYVGTSGYAAFIDGLALGDRIVVRANVQNYGGKYELMNPVKVSSEKSCLTFAYEFYSHTQSSTGICYEYDGVTDNKAALQAIWEGLETSYNALSDGEKAKLLDPVAGGCGNTVKNAMSLYDYVVGKYGLTNFITGRTPVVIGGTNALLTIQENNVIVMTIVLIALVTISSVALLTLKKRRFHK